MLARRKYKRLTAREVAKLSSQPGWHNDGDGLYLRVAKTGAAGWVWRYLSGQRERYMGLGPVRHVSLAEARQKADEARRLKRDGIDPLDAKHDKQLGTKLKTAKAMSFQQCAEAYIKAHAAGWRSADHSRQWRASLATLVYPTLGDLPVSAIDTSLVMQVLEPIWATKTVTASRVRGRIETVLNWAVTREYRAAGDNPARWKGHLQNLLPKKSKLRRVKHHPAMPYAEIADFMDALRQQDNVNARALEFAILTCARRDEVRGARWSEIDPFRAEKMWVIPAERMKAEREHRVPLSDAAVVILDKMEAIRTSDFVFPGRDPGQQIAPRALVTVLQGLGRGEVTQHGFRSTFRDWARETTDHAREACELALAHNIGTEAELAYARGPMVEKRRKLMADWAGYCGRLPEEHGTVVAFGR